MSEILCEKIGGFYQEHTDTWDDLVPTKHHFVSLLNIFEKAISKGGEAALEIGVRCGGTSAAMCALAQVLRPDSFQIISVDPYGGKPYNDNKVVTKNMYPDISFYVAAKKLLAEFENHQLFKMESYIFLRSVLPSMRWWANEQAGPKNRRFLSFVFIDGAHDNWAVAMDLGLVLEFLTPQAIVVLDNISYSPQAIEWIKGCGLKAKIEPLAPDRLLLEMQE